MWDLGWIIRQNNNAALQCMMEGQQTAEAQAPQPESWALSILAERLRVGPPLLKELMECFASYDVVERFLHLVRTYLPEHEADILSQPRGRRVYRFRYHFGQKYYPLPSWSTDNLAVFVVGMPVELKAMSYSAYHELAMRQGYLLLLSLVVYPYQGDDRDMEDDDVPFNPFEPMGRYSMEARFTKIAQAKAKKSGWQPSRSDIAWVKGVMSQLQDGGRWIAPMGFTIIKVDSHTIELLQAENTPEVRETIRRTMLIAEKAGLQVKVTIGKTAEEKQVNGARIPLLDLMQGMVGEDMARRIPLAGWEPSQLHQMTDGTAYDGVGHFADWVCSETKCVVLDSNYDDCYFIEGSGEPIFEWSKFNVDTLTKEWPKVREIREKIDHMVEWLEANPIGRFAELLEFLLDRSAELPKVAVTMRARAYDPTEFYCPLDQKDMYDDDDENGEDEEGIEQHTHLG